MPEVSRFYGIIVKMYFNDHAPPHFHAFYGEHEVLVSITTLAVIAGKLPHALRGSWLNGRFYVRTNFWLRGRGQEIKSRRGRSSLCREGNTGILSVQGLELSLDQSQIPPQPLPRILQIGMVEALRDFAHHVEKAERGAESRFVIVKRAVTL